MSLILFLLLALFSEFCVVYGWDPVCNSTVLYSDFTFVVSAFNSSRQYGKCLNMIVTYRYASTDVSHYYDYREIANTARYYLQPTPSIPYNSQWEVVNKAFFDDIWKSPDYDFVGMSSQIQVMSRNTTAIDETGNHGSTITQGNINPLREPEVNNFWYDCTQFSSLEESEAAYMAAYSSSDVSSNNDNSDYDAGYWKGVAVTFIVLFVFLIIALAGCLWYIKCRTGINLI
jgi:hypothetical protein